MYEKYLHRFVNLSTKQTNVFVCLDKFYLNAPRFHNYLKSLHKDIEKQLNLNINLEPRLHKENRERDSSKCLDNK